MILTRNEKGDQATKNQVGAKQVEMVFSPIILAVCEFPGFYHIGKRDCFLANLWKDFDYAKYTTNN